jgi:hypothetical protein
MTAEPEIVEDRRHTTIRREHVERDQDRFHVDGVLNRLQTFYSLEKARLYADVYAVVDGFREEKTGERGCPPAVAAAREDVQMAYYAAQPTMSVAWVAGQYDTDRATVREYLELVQERAADQRADN